MSNEEGGAPQPEVSKPSSPEREDTIETAEISDSEHGKTAATIIGDEEALSRAKDHMRNDQVLAAFRLIQQMKNIPEEETIFETEVKNKAALVERVIDDLLSNPEVSLAEDVAAAEGGTTSTTGGDQGWIKMGETHSGHRDTVSYYHLSEDLQLKMRLETPIESSLLVPLLSVLIETDLFTTWLPKWTVPRIGLGSVTKLAQMGRTEQIVHFISEVPWPFTPRDVMLQTLACDDIDDIESPTGNKPTGTIAVGMFSLEGGEEVRKSVVCNDYYKDEKEVLDIPPAEDAYKRADFNGGLLIRKCPDDHVCLQHSTVEYPPDEHLILVGLSMQVDGKINPMFPTTIINFVIQTAIVQMWAMFLTVAEEIRDGNRPLHAEAIAKKREEIYDWVDKRIEDMFQNLHQNKGDSATASDEVKTEEKKDATDG